MTTHVVILGVCSLKDNSNIGIYKAQTYMTSHAVVLLYCSMNLHDGIAS